MEILTTTSTIRLAALSACLLSACATITTGTDQGIRIITEKDITGASCTLEDSKGNRSYIPRTPGTTYMTRGNAPLTITCTKPGYKTTTLVADEEMAGATMGNVILGGGIGIILDASSGAAQRYPDQVVIWMEPAQWPDEAARLQWEADKRAFLEASLSAEEDGKFSGDNDDFD